MQGDRRGVRAERPYGDRGDRPSSSRADDRPAGRADRASGGSEDRRSDRSPSAARRPVGKRSAPPGADRRTDRRADGSGQDRRARPGEDRRGDDRRGDDRRGEDRRPRGGEGRGRPEPPRPGLERKANEPPIPEGVDVRALHRAARAELRGLPKDLAEIVASHLVVAGQLIEDDPALAYAHAEAARRRAARLPIVREAAAETAYAAGLWDVALSEFRALRRMTGTDDYLPVMADCERALGRPHHAVKLAREADRLQLDPALRIEMTIVEAGARSDLGQHPEALRILQRAVAETRQSPAVRLPVARLRYAYADALLQGGDETEARRWFAAAAKLDTDGELDAFQRVDELDGLLIEFDDESEDDEEAASDNAADGDGSRPDGRPTP